MATYDDCEYEELAHTSEVGVRVYAASVGALYVCAARAMFGLLQAEPDMRSDATNHSIELASPDAESLLVDWLGELLYLHETTGLVVAACEVTIWSPRWLEAEVTLHAPRIPPSMHIKAVTYHQLLIEETVDGWRAEVFFDI